VRDIVCITTACWEIALAAPAAGDAPREENGAPIDYLALGGSAAAIDNGDPEQLAAALELTYAAAGDPWADLENAQCSAAIARAFERVLNRTRVERLP
jgi:hypothetical protein